MTDAARRASRDADGPDGSHVAAPNSVSRSRAGTSGVSMLLGLQGSIGNRAVCDLLTVQRDVTNFTLGQGADATQSPMSQGADPAQSPMYTGGPMFPGAPQSNFTLGQGADATQSPMSQGAEPAQSPMYTGGPMFPGAPQSKATAAVAPLPAEQRSELTRLTGNRISRAFTAFALAAEQNRAAIKAAAADSPDFATLLLEIALGTLLPGISRGIASLAAELPATASTTAYRVALAAMNEERTTKLLETGVKVGREFLKGGTRLEGETEIDTFLNTLEDLFNKGADEVDKNLPNLSDDALGITCAAYDPSVAGQTQFRAAVQALVAKYHRQVEPIATTVYHWMNRQSNFMLYWVVSPKGGKRLALLENYGLKEWISPELQEIAIKKFEETAGRYYHGQVPEISADRVEDLSG